jgi:ketosteroid isomerase-like protein
VSLELDSLATRTQARELIDSFARGWSKADAELLASVFTEDAVFLETPFVEPIKGVVAIKRYWADVPYHQSEITVTTGEIYVAGPWFSTEFRARFRRRRSGEWVDARGAIFAETTDGKISEMRMYWHRWSGGREIFAG